jgi:predicted enzyme related to lactoylglutathione lyase
MVSEDSLPDTSIPTGMNSANAEDTALRDGDLHSHAPAWATGLGVPPHWLPYVAVDDADATIARARQLRATVPLGPEDIPGVGRFGALEDPTGAVLAIIRPLPMETQG